MGEHLMQNELLLSMALSHKLIDGKIVSLHDYLDGKLEQVTTNMTKEQASTVINKNKELRAEAEKQFQEAPSVFDLYEFKDGYVEIKPEYKVSEVELANFKIRVKGVNQDLHGIYNKLDKGMIQKAAVGRLLLQFRNWLRPGWNKRFGSKFNKSFFNERRGALDKGTYISLKDFIFNPFKDKAPYNWLDARAVFGAARAIVRDYGKFIANAKIHWHALSLDERSRVRKAAQEMAWMMGVIVLLSALGGGDEDDDEKRKMKSYNILMYQLSRLQTELAAYTPVYGWFNEGKKMIASPAASFTLLTNSAKFTWEIFRFPFVDEDTRRYQSGVYRDEYKSYIYFKKLLPGVTQYHKYHYINQMNKYYRLF
jgi:hypothetical protein